MAGLVECASHHRGPAAACVEAHRRLSSIGQAHRAAHEPFGAGHHVLPAGHSAPSALAIGRIRGRASAAERWEAPPAAAFPAASIAYRSPASIQAVRRAVHRFCREHPSTASMKRTAATAKKWADHAVCSGPTQLGEGRLSQPGGGGGSSRRGQRSSSRSDAGSPAAPRERRPDAKRRIPAWTGPVGLTECCGRPLTAPQSRQAHCRSTASSPCGAPHKTAGCARRARSSPRGPDEGPRKGRRS